MPTKKSVPEHEQLVKIATTKRTVEPFLRLGRSIQETGEYNAGFDKGSEGTENDRSQSFAWQRGWADADEDKTMSHATLVGQ
jgi:hypothetical protein